MLIIYTPRKIIGAWRKGGMDANMLICESFAANLGLGF